MTRYVLLFACSLLLWTACSEDDGPLNPPDLTESDEYAVWSATLDSMVIWEKDDVVVLRSFTDAWALDDPATKAQLKSQLKVTDEELLNYDTRNASSSEIRGYTLESYLDNECVLLREKEIEDILASGGYQELYRRYPKSNGITTLSHVGFNASRTSALVYLSHTPEFLAGAGWAVLLRKQSGVWVVQASTIVWMS